MLLVFCFLIMSCLLSFSGNLLRGRWFLHVRPLLARWGRCHVPSAPCHSWHYIWINAFSIAHRASGIDADIALPDVREMLLLSTLLSISNRHALFFIFGTVYGLHSAHEVSPFSKHHPSCGGGHRAYQNIFPRWIWYVCWLEGHPQKFSPL